MKGILVVRKYKNRRLYDTERSVHVTQEELLGLIRAGRTVQVQEAVTGEDVTIETLLQLIQSERGLSSEVMPSEFLHFLIRSDDGILQRFFREFMPTAMQSYQSMLAGMQRGLAPGFPGWSGMQAMPWMQPWGAAPGPAAAAGPAPAPEPPPTEAPPPKRKRGRPRKT